MTAFIVSMASAAFAAGGSLQTDLEASVNGVTKSFTISGTVAGGSAQTHAVDLSVSGTDGAATSWQVTGASPTGSTVVGSMAAVAVGSDGVSESGTISWTTPAAQATNQTYTLTIEFAATGGAYDINTNGATVTITFTVAGSGSGPVDSDDDGVPDSSDNCPNVANNSQANADGDALGDACDSNSYAPAVGTDAVNQSGNEGTQQTNSGSFTDADTGGAAGLVITATGAGTVTPDGTGGWTWSYTPGDNGTGTVTVTASDGQHTSAVDSFTWTATNVAPTLSALALGGATGTACQSGNNVTLDFGFTDPGFLDTWTVDVNWGDGSTHGAVAASAGTQSQASHSYAPGAYTISVAVRDDDGDTDSDTGSVARFYDMTGILSPFNADGTSVWKYGSTIPVKVKVTDCDSKPVSGLALQVGTRLVTAGSPGDAIGEAASTSAADTGTVMRYDATAGQYIYNFATKSLSDGNASYYMIVKNVDVLGETNTGADATGQSYQRFGLRLK